MLENGPSDIDFTYNKIKINQIKQLTNWLSAYKK